MIDELHKLLEAYAHLRDLPQYKNLMAKVVSRIKELEESLEQKVEAKATPPGFRRAIPAKEAGNGNP